MRPSRTSVLAYATFAALATATFTSACSGGGSSESDATRVSTTASVTDQADSRVSDGILKIGVLVPLQLLDQQGYDAMKVVLEATTNTINASGGFRGQPVEVRIEVETGDPDADVDTISSLVNDVEVDALIGPSAASLTELVALDVVSAGVGLCSPVAAPVALEEIPGNELLIRTVPSEATFASAMAQLVEDSGFATASIVYPDDHYGRQFVESLHQQLDIRELNRFEKETAASDVDIPYSVDATGGVSAAIDLGRISTSVVLVIGESNVAPAILGRLGVKRVISNDGFIDVDRETILDPEGRPITNSLRSFAGVAIDAYAGTAQVLSDVRSQGVSIDSDTRIPFLARFVDCLNVIALSALATSSDDAGVFMIEVQATTTSGTKCQRFDECIVALEQFPNVDYDGPTGELDLDANGNVADGSVLIYTFDSDGVPFVNDRLNVSG